MPFRAISTASTSVDPQVLGMVFAAGVKGLVGAGELTTFEGRPLIAHVLTMVSSQTAEVIVCGGHFGGQDDVAKSEMSVLDALAAAMEVAIRHDMEAVFTCPYTIPLIPRDLVLKLSGGGPAVVDGSPLLGFWPIWLADDLASARQQHPEMSLTEWATRVSARQVKLPVSQRAVLR